MVSTTPCGGVSSGSNPDRHPRHVIIDKIMNIIVDFLKDAAKIVFGSAVVGFFIPGLADGGVKIGVFFGGIVATVTFLILAVVLSKLKK